MLALLRWASFWPPSISVIIYTNITNYISSCYRPSVESFHVLLIGREHGREVWRSVMIILLTLVPTCYSRGLQTSSHLCTLLSNPYAVTYFISLKVSKGLWYLGNSDYFHVKDWIQDTFTAHFFPPFSHFLFTFRF